MPGHPPPSIHRRTIDVEVGPAADGLRPVGGRVLDRRYRGLSRVGSHVTRPGVVHDMSVEMVLDTGRGAIESARGAMRKAAFDGDPETRFETCRDVLPNVAALAGVAVDGGLAREIRAAIGRERGCYHLTTLVLATAPVLQRLLVEPLPPAVGMRRHVELDADDLPGGRVRFRGRLDDVTDNGDERRTRLAFTVDPDGLTPLDVEVERASGPDTGGEVARRLAGLSLAAGFARAAIDRLRGEAEVLELALGISAIFTQSFIGSGRRREDGDGRDPPRARNTCWMWRDGGPLQGLPTGIVDE